MASPLRVTHTPDAPARSPTEATRAEVAPAGLTLTDILLLLMALIWGGNYIVVKFGTQVLAPLAFNSSRITLAVVVLWITVLARRSPMPSRRDFIALLALGALGNGIYQIFFVEGVARTRPSDAALVLAASPALIEVISWLRGLERTGMRGVAGIALSLGGIGLVVSGGGSSAAAGSSFGGFAYVVAACACWALYSVLLKPYTDRIDGVTLSAVTMTGGLIPMLIAAAPSLASTPWHALGARGWGAIAYSGLLALVLAYLFWYRGVRVLGPTRASMYANLQPLFAILITWMVLGEAPRGVQIAGAVCIMSGLLLTRLPTPTPMAGE